MKQLIKKALNITGYQAFPKGTLAIDNRQIKNIIYIGDMYGKIKGIPGAIVECGVGKGRTFLYFSSLASKDGRTIWGFDSFEGFPEPTKEDASKRNPKKGEWAYETLDSIRNILKVAGVQADVKLVKGFVEDTLGQYDKSPIALLHIDLDLYSAYKVTLNELVKFVSKGGIVMFDEYGAENWPGATKAVDEYMKDKSWKLEKHSEMGKYYFVKS
jgi:hypothetical protein